MPRNQNLQPLLPSTSRRRVDSVIRSEDLWVLKWDMSFGRLEQSCSFQIRRQVRSEALGMSLLY